MIRIELSEIQKEKIETIYWGWIKRLHLKKFISVLKQDDILRTLIMKGRENRDDRELADAIKEFLLLDCNKLEEMKKYIEELRIQNKNIGEDTKKYLLERYKNYRNSQAAKIIQILGISVCPYCNQNYINVVYDKKGKVRFWGDLDHFYDKSTYPELAVCLYNMIPVCKTCNQLKSSQKKSIVNPYNSQRKSRIKFGTDFDNKFDLDYLQGKSKNFNIVINKKVLTLEDKEEIEVFDLDNRYQQLKQNVQEIIIKSKAYDERYQKNLKEQFQFNDEELESYIFGYTENHLNRALSKFNLDIMNEFRNKGNCKEVGRSISKMKE